MEFKPNEWIGKWVNFESYIYSDNAAMKKCWEEAEKAASVMPMFKNGVKRFWETACNTINGENPVRLGGWNIIPAENGMEIEWLDESGNSLGRYKYTLAEIVEKGLEAKPNFLFYAETAPIDSPFRYLLAMEPMPRRAEKENGGLLSHLHFQYASTRELLLADERLCNPMWYPTMCDEGTLLQQCNIVRALHRMDKWNKLPE